MIGAKFSVQQRKALRARTLHATSTVQLDELAEFLCRYFILEAVLRTLCQYFRDRIPQAKRLTGHEALNIQQVKKAFGHFSIKVSVERLESLISSARTKRNSKSARLLRNGIVHQWSLLDIAEVGLRKPELCRSIDATLAAIEKTVKGG